MIQISNTKKVVTIPAVSSGTDKTYTSTPALGVGWYSKGLALGRLYKGPFVDLVIGIWIWSPPSNARKHLKKKKKW
jgi:hypothetical protein